MLIYLTSRPAKLKRKKPMLSDQAVIITVKTKILSVAGSHSPAMWTGEDSPYVKVAKIANQKSKLGKFNY